MKCSWNKYIGLPVNFLINCQVISLAWLYGQLFYCWSHPLPEHVSPQTWPAFRFGQSVFYDPCIQHDRGLGLDCVHPKWIRKAMLMLIHKWGLRTEVWVHSFQSTEAVNDHLSDNSDNLWCDTPKTFETQFSLTSQIKVFPTVMATYNTAIESQEIKRLSR